jgi:hypothetical protein
MRVGRTAQGEAIALSLADRGYLYAVLLLDSKFDEQADKFGKALAELKSRGSPDFGKFLMSFFENVDGVQFESTVFKFVSALDSIARSRGHCSNEQKEALHTVISDMDRLVSETVPMQTARAHARSVLRRCGM